MKTRGFTLIELLVVISIIGLLSSVVLASLNSARAKARDATRKAEVVQIQRAFELYYDANGQYPASGGATSPNGGWSNSNDSSWAILQTALKPYMSVLPSDPAQSASDWAGDGFYSYAYFSLGYGCNQQWYMLVYKLENQGGAVSPGSTACDGTYFNYGGTMTVGSKAK